MTAVHIATLAYLAVHVIYSGIGLVVSDDGATSFGHLLALVIAGWLLAANAGVTLG